MFLLKSKVLSITFLLKSKVLSITFWHPGGFEKSPARRPGGFEIRRKKIARKKQLLAISYITFSQ
jgi:hypothetical protein